MNINTKRFFLSQEVQSNASHGLVAQKAAKVQVDDCNIQQNKLSGVISIHEGSIVNIHGGSVKDNKVCGNALCMLTFTHFYEAFLLLFLIKRVLFML
jgi:hypothetical protein